MMSMKILIVSMLMLLTHAGLNIGRDDPFGNRFPEKFTRKISMLIWEDPIHSKEWQRAKVSYALDTLAEELTLLMDEYDVPVQWKAGDIAFAPMMDRAPAAWIKLGKKSKEPGASMSICGQRWSDWKKKQGLSPILGAADEHIRACAIPRVMSAVPEKNFPGNTGWLGPAGIASAGAALFVTAENTIISERKRLGNFVSYGTPLHEAIHTFNCGHGSQFQAECDKMPKFHLNYVMNGGCSGLQKMPRIAVVNDPDKEVCIKDKNEQEACMNPKDRRGGGCGNVFNRNMYVASAVGVKRCDATGKKDWRGYCLVSEGFTCNRPHRFSRGKFVHVLEALEFVKTNRPCGQNNDLIMTHGPMWWFCCRGDDVSKFEKHVTDQGDLIVDRRVFKPYDSFTPEIAKSPVYPTPRSKLPIRIPTYNRLCQNCYCMGLGGALVNWGFNDPDGIDGRHTPSFEECRAIAASSGSKFISYRPRDGDKPTHCWHSKTCTRDPAKMCMPDSFHQDTEGIDTYIIEGADPNEIPTDAFGPTIPAGWDVCGELSHKCHSNSKLVSLAPRGSRLKNYFHQCAEVCSSFPFFTLLNNNDKQCFCHEKCDRQRSWGGFPTIFRRITDTPPNKCAGVTCTARSQCHKVGVCTDGVCSNPLKSDGSTCDDNDSSTTDDICRAGVCRGENKCAGVTCTARSECHKVGVCTDGVCSNPLKPDGSTCDDNDSSTTNDVCRAGVCRGETNPRPSVCVRNPKSRFQLIDRSTRRNGMSEEDCAKLCRDDTNCYGVSFWSNDGSCIQNLPGSIDLMANQKAVSFVCKAGCDTRRKRCCSYNSKWGLVPLVDWGNTPEEEKAWFERHGCNEVMGGRDLSNCPYDCGEARSPALLDSAPGSGRRVAEVDNPDPLQKLGEVQCCKDGKCSRRFPSDSTSNADCLSGVNDSVKFTFQEAIDLCEKLGSGWSLCTRTEVNSNICRGKGCGHDHQLAWAFHDASGSRRVLSEGQPLRKV